MAYRKNFNRIVIAALVLNFIFASTLFAQAITSLHRASLAPQTNAQGQSYSYDPNIDGSGRFIAFTSTADNFAAPGKVVGQVHEHVYLRDTVSGITTQLDLTSDGRTGSPGTSFNPNIRVFRSSFHPHLSRDGKYLVFTSTESNISPDGAGEQFGNWAYLKNLETGDIHRIPYATAGDPSKAEYPSYLAINGDGSKVVVISIISDATDMDCSTCVWELTIYDRNSNTTTLINTGAPGNKFNPAISDDGRFVVFESQVGDFSGPTYTYLYDLDLAQLLALNDGKISLSPSISGDGKYIAYSDSSIIATSIRLRERESGIETIVSRGLNGADPAGISEFSSLSQDGRYIAFLSSADNLVANDSNGSDDIFVYDRVADKTTLVSVQGVCKGIQTTESFNTGPPTISSDGTTIAFTVLERLIASDRKDRSGHVTENADTNRFDDVYVATLDYDAEPLVFKKGLTPDAPFVTVNCSGALARVQVQDVLKARPGRSAKPPRVGTKGESIKRITLQVVISKVNTVTGHLDVRQQLLAKRNLITTSGLPPGTYASQVRARAFLNNGSSIASRLSKPATFTITK